MEDQIEPILKMARTVAVVGLSPDPCRPSYAVAEYLKRHGYRIIPVNPSVEEILGERSYPSLRAIPEAVDVVDVFRRPDDMPSVIEDAIAAGAKVVWMPEGVRHEDAAARARACGILVVMDRCMKKELERLRRAGRRQ